MRRIEIRQDDVRRRAKRKNGINSEKEKRGSTTEREDRKTASTMEKLYVSRG